MSVLSKVYRRGVKWLRILSGAWMRPVYVRWIRPRLAPGPAATLAGIPVFVTRALDARLPRYAAPVAFQDLEWQLHTPDYEHALIDGLRRYVRPGDHVCVVGGGWGVTAVVAAQQAGPEGRVEVFEGSRGCYRRIENTFALNGVQGVRLHHAIVGKEVSVLAKHRKDLGPLVKDVPPCDVLELDCEGSERFILEDLPFRPRVLIVETHGMLGAPTALVRDLVHRLGYEVVYEDVAETRMRDYCLESDIKVLHCLRKPPEADSAAALTSPG